MFSRMQGSPAARTCSASLGELSAPFPEFNTQTRSPASRRSSPETRSAPWFVQSFPIYCGNYHFLQDRRIISLADLHSPLPPMEATQAPFTDLEESNNPGEGSSAKIDQLIQLLRLTPSSEKSLVFSQFTRYAHASFNLCTAVRRGFQLS